MLFVVVTGGVGGGEIGNGELGGGLENTEGSFGGLLTVCSNAGITLVDASIGAVLVILLLPILYPETGTPKVSAGLIKVGFDNVITTFHTPVF